MSVQEYLSQHATAALHTSLIKQLGFDPNYPITPPINLRHTFIAGIATARRATLATHNVRYFDDLSIPVVNPWTDR